MVNSAEIIFSNELEARVFAHNLAKSLNKGDIITFTGDLGSGKTLLCREIIRYFCGVNVNVISPTFNLLQTYSAPNFIIYHFDLYRLKSQNELYELGMEEAFEKGVCLIEWPQIVETVLTGRIIRIQLEIATNNHRKCIVEL